MPGIKFGGVLQPALARTTSRVATTRLAMVRWQPAFSRWAELYRQFVAFVAALLTPAAVVAMVIGMWRLGADLGWADQFVIASGVLSHWQVWFLLAGVLRGVSVMLGRPADRPEGSGQAG